MTFKLDWRAMEETLFENAAAEMIRFNVARRCGEAFIERIKERLTEDNVGADGRPVLTGGLRTGQMWRGFKIKPGGQGARGYFAGSSFNSRYYETEIQKKPDRDLIEFEKTLSQKEKIIRKRTAAKKGVALGKIKSVKKVANRIKARSVQWGRKTNDETGDYSRQGRAFLGFTDAEAATVIAWLEQWLIKRYGDAQAVRKMGWQINRALKMSEDMKKKLHQRAGR